MLNIYIPPKDKFDIESIIKRQYKEVNEKFFQRRPEMTIEGKPIIIQFGEKKLLESMDDIPDNYFYELFFHLCTNEQYRDFEINCSNVAVYKLCAGGNRDCNKVPYTIFIKNKKRYLCMYRLCRVHWISKIIDEYNNGSDFTCFYESSSNSYLMYYRNTRRNSILYLIVFTRDRDKYIFKTAYPVTSSKDRKRFMGYIKNVKQNKKTDSLSRIC